MPNDIAETNTAGPQTRRIFYYNAGFLRQKRIRRILDLAGYSLRIGKPSAEDAIAVWGHSPYARRGEAMANRTGAQLLRVEDAQLRSVHPGRTGALPLGLVVDHTGVHFDASAPSDLETLLATHSLDDTALLDRARGCIARLQEAHLSKYNAFDPKAACPDPGYVLVIDQTRGDASVTYGGADANSFREMLYYAQEENPGSKILIKTHPETVAGHREGYFGPEDVTEGVFLCADPVSPWALMDGAVAVYTVSSSLGFEAIFAGHKPRVFGQPFYAGWGLTDDRHPQRFARRGRALSRAQLFAASMILYPIWYDPHQDELCSLETAINTLEAQTRAWREDHSGWIASGMRLWKRKSIQQFFGTQGVKVQFTDNPRPNPPQRHMIWARQSPNDSDAVRVEDGFLRSKGLGATLVPAMSLVCDDLGIYYDPTRESRLERLIRNRPDLRPDQIQRVDALIKHLTRDRLSKYNLGGAIPELPEGHRILVVGQVEDDASIKLGAGEINTNLALLERTRGAHPEAVILFKPHPDVEAGLRNGFVPDDALEQHADAVLHQSDPAVIMDHIDEVWTMTSLLGFEALIRDLPVTTTGAPFYAGWGLTHDLGQVPARRAARPTRKALIHATLIDYPRYIDPLTSLPCPVEIVASRLANAEIGSHGVGNSLLRKIQGLFASRAHIWR